MYKYSKNIIEHIKLIFNKELKKFNFLTNIVEFKVEFYPTVNTHFDITSIKLSFFFNKNKKLLQILKKKIKNLHISKYSIFFISEKSLYFNIKLENKFVYFLIFKKYTNNKIKFLKKINRILVDYSSPNISKKLHIGHIRSLIMGIFLTKILKLFGYYIIKNSHFGNWGSKLGNVLYLVMAGGINFSATNSINYLNTYYSKSSSLENKYIVFTHFFKKYLECLHLWSSLKLTRLWVLTNKTSKFNFQNIYSTFKNKFDLTKGEVFFAKKFKAITLILMGLKFFLFKNNLIFVFLKQTVHIKWLFIPVAEIKSKGLTTYVITDLANVYFNCQYSSADKLIYVTDSRQFKHFILLFKHIYEIYNIYYIKKLKFIHFLFGSVSFSNNIPIASRGGNNVNLMTFLFKIKKKLNINFESYKKFSKCYKISLYYIKSFDFSTNKFCNYSVIELLKTLKTQVNSNFIIFLAYTLNKIEEHFIKKRYIKNKNLRYVYEEIIWFKYILIKIEFFEYNLQQVFKKLSPKTLMSYSLDFLNWIYKKINYFKVNSLTINIIIKCKWVLLTTLNIL